MSAALANDSRARPKVLGSSTTDMGLLRITYLKVGLREARVAPQPGPTARPTNAAAGPRVLAPHPPRRKLVQRAAPPLLIRSRCVNDDCRWRPARPAVVDESARHGRRSPEPHQDDDGDAVRT